jgi:hypothetical protein
VISDEHGVDPTGTYHGDSDLQVSAAASRVTVPSLPTLCASEAAPSVPPLPLEEWGWHLESSSRGGVPGIAHGVVLCSWSASTFTTTRPPVSSLPNPAPSAALLPPQLKNGVGLPMMRGFARWKGSVGGARARVDRQVDVVDLALAFARAPPTDPPPSVPH